MLPFQSHPRGFNAAIDACAGAGETWQGWELLRMAESTVTMRDMSSLPWALARCIGRGENWRDVRVEYFSLHFLVHIPVSYFQCFYLEERVNVKPLLCQCRSEPRHAKTFLDPPIAWSIGRLKQPQVALPRCWFCAVGL